MDSGFVNDTTIYYNFSPETKPLQVTGRSTLPRPHSSFIIGRPSSCPSSPKLSFFRPKPKPQQVSSTESAPNEARETTDGFQGTVETNGVSGRKEEENKCAPISSGGFVVYQNVDNPQLKAKRKPLNFFPWWKRKRFQNQLEETNSGILMKAEPPPPLQSPQHPSSLPDSQQLQPKPVRKPWSPPPPLESQPFPSNYLALPSYSSTGSSSSTTLNEDDDKSEDECHEERVLGGISYVRPSKTPQGRQDPEKVEAKVVTSSPERPRHHLDFPQKVSHWVWEWHRKSRWLARRAREKNPRHNGDGDVDIALVHYGSDTAMWVDYLRDRFLHLLQDKLGRFQVKVENIDMENFSVHRPIPEVQATRLHEAKLQIVILSPSFLSFLKTESEIQIGKLLRPKRVLALLLGVTPQTVKSNSVASSVLYSFEEWVCLQVRDRDESFVAQVQEESLRLLTQCDVFDQCKTSSAFSVCPRKITQSYCKVYIHLKTPLHHVHERQIRVAVSQSLKAPPAEPQVQCHNPFTLSFDMPEKFLGVSSFLKLSLYVDNAFVGCREVKCEGPLEILNDLLKSAVDPTGLMCQALGICPVSNELDEILCQRVVGKIPLSRGFIDLRRRDVPVTHELPTWLHFSAFYGLHRFTWALLDVPGGESALFIKNCKGHTPPKLALQARYTKLAQDLENVAIVTSLARKASSSNNDGLLSKEDSSLEGYSPVPRPRPYVPNDSTYDFPPSRKFVKETTSSLSQRNKEILSSTPNQDETLYANLLLDSPPPPILNGEKELSMSPKSVDEEMKKEEYLDMTGMSLQMEEYQKDVSILVDAWDKRNNAQAFLNEYEHTIFKLKENFHFKNEDTAEEPSASCLLSGSKDDFNEESTWESDDD